MIKTYDKKIWNEGIVGYYLSMTIRYYFTGPNLIEFIRNQKTQIVVAYCLINSQ